MSMRTACLAGAAALVLTAAAACSSGGGSSSASPSVQASNSSIPVAAPKAGGSLTVLEGKGFSGDWPLGFDPATNTTGSADQDYYNAVYGQLFELGDNGKLIYDLATGYQYSNGNKTVTIDLRPGVKFSDGSPLTAMLLFEVCTDGAVEADVPPLPLLHAAAADSTSAAAPARQAVRIDISRNLTGIHLLVINRTLVGDKNRVDRPEICLGYSHPPGEAARSNKQGLPRPRTACIRPPPAASRRCVRPQTRLSARSPAYQPRGPGTDGAAVGRGAAVGIDDPSAEGGTWRTTGKPGAPAATPALPGR